MKVTPIRKFNGRNPGEVLTFPEATARALIKARLMVAVDEEAPRKRRTYQRRDMQAEA